MNPDATSLDNTGPRRRWLLRGLPLLPISLVIGFFSFSTVFVAFGGGFFPTQVYSITSPDGRSKLVVTKRVIFPANEILDPAIKVTVQLRDTATDRVFDSIKLDLEEDSDLCEPNVKWTPEAARVTEIDDRYERSFILQRGI